MLNRSDAGRWWDEVWRAAWPLLLLTLLCVIFYWDVLWLAENQMILGEDAADMHLRWLRFAVSSVREGRFPLWNPYLFSGQPLVANPQAALFYPPTWLTLLMPVTQGLSLIAVLHLWLGGVGLYGWLRAEGASRVGSLFGAVVFTFSGYFSVRMRAGHIGVITTQAWLPVLLWAYRRAVAHPSARRAWRVAVLGGLPVGLSILAGHSASFVYVALGLAAYALFCAGRAWRDAPSARAAWLPLAWLVVMLLVGAAVAAVQLLPMLEYTARTTRQVAPSYEFAARFSWPPGYLLTLLIPNFFGEPIQTGYWGDGIHHEFMFYVGILPLLLALLGVGRKRRHLTRFLFGLGLGSLLLALGSYGPLHPLFYRFFPLFRMMRAPARAGFLFTLACAALSGLVLDGEERGRLLRPLTRPTVLLVAGGAVGLILLDFVMFAWGRDSNPAAGRLWHQANQVALFLLFFLLSAGLLTAWRSASSRGGEAGLGRFRWMALGLVLLDLWTYGSSTVEVVDVPERAGWRVAARAVEDPQAARVLPWGLSDVEQSGGMDFGLRTVFGYDPLVLQRYQTFIDSRPDPRARTYDLLNAGYVMALAPLDLPEASDSPDAPRLLVQEAGAWVYERPGALPRAWIAPEVRVMAAAAMLARIHEPDFDPRATVLVEQPLVCPNDGTAGTVDSVRDEGNRIEANVRGGGGVLVLSEVAYPGWQAAVDGQPASLVRVDYLLRGLCVPPGEHRIELWYDPPLLKVGLVVTGLTLFALIGAVSLPWIQRRRVD